MPRTLFGKFLVVLLAFGAMMTAIFAGIMQLSHENYHLELDQRAAGTLASRIEAQGLGQIGASESPEALHQRLERLSAVNTGTDLYVLDGEGNVLASSVAAPGVKRDRVDMRPVQRYLLDPDSRPILGIDPTEVSRTDVFSVAPILAGGVGEHYLYALLHRREHQAGAGMIKASYLLGDGIWIVAGGVLFAVLSSLLIVRMLTGRLSRLAEAMQRFRRSGFTEPPALPVDRTGRTDDELAQLAKTFADMAHRMVEQMRELKRMDLLRRDLLANVSQGLRAPLSSTQKHLEALSHEDAGAGKAERQDCIENAARQTRRMAKLVGKLSELAKLEASQVTLRRETFALCDIVQDVMQKHSLSAAQEGVTLQAELSGRLPFVDGDIALIEQALDNLVENALAHTPRGGRIAVRATEGVKTITVEAADTGAGMDSENLARDFGRAATDGGAVSVDTRRPKLGLAIVKNILELHGSAIRVTSTFGIGTTISFDLPAKPGLQGEARGLQTRWRRQCSGSAWRPWQSERYSGEAAFVAHVAVRRYATPMEKLSRASNATNAIRNRAGHAFPDHWFAGHTHAGATAGWIHGGIRYERRYASKY